MNDTAKVRVSKLLSERGLCSRREADGLDVREPVECPCQAGGGILAAGEQHEGGVTRIVVGCGCRHESEQRVGEPREIFQRAAADAQLAALVCGDPQRMAQIPVLHV